MRDEVFWLFTGNMKWPVNL